MARRLAALPNTLPEDASHSWVLAVDLPERPFLCSELFPALYGVRLDHGARPWPFFRDGDGPWWAMNEPYALPAGSVVLLVDLDQLGYHPPESRRPFLVEVVTELQRRLAPIGARLRPDCTLDEALAKTDQVHQQMALAQIRVAALVRHTEGERPTMEQGWAAMEEAGLVPGEGDLLWREVPGETERICVEPIGEPGALAPTQRASGRPFPDLALWIRVFKLRRPVGAVGLLGKVAQRVAAPLGAVVVDDQGAPWTDGTARARLRALLSLPGAE